MTADGSQALVAHATSVGTRLADGAYVAWQVAQIESDLALTDWCAASPGRRSTAHNAYREALDWEEAAARDLEELCRLTRALSESETDGLQ